jgi:hypothetical protein
VCRRVNKCETLCSNLLSDRRLILGKCYRRRDKPREQSTNEAGDEFKSSRKRFVHRGLLRIPSYILQQNGSQNAKAIPRRCTQRLTSNSPECRLTTGQAYDLFVRAMATTSAHSSNTSFAQPAFQIDCLLVRLLFRRRWAGKPGERFHATGILAPAFAAFLDRVKWSGWCSVQALLSRAVAGLSAIDSARGLHFGNTLVP